MYNSASWISKRCRRKGNQAMIQTKNSDNVNIAFRDEYMSSEVLKGAPRKAEQTVVKKYREPRVLVECNFIVEVSQSVASKGNHANYIRQLVRGMVEQNKHIREVFDIDAFEPEAEGA